MLTMSLMPIAIWIVLLSIFWPLTLGYAIQHLTKNTKATTILTSIITVTTLYFALTTPYTYNIFFYASLISVCAALFTWMYDMAS
jgi:hypothetical protein